MKRALTPTLIICLAASITAGIALSRPASEPTSAGATPTVVSTPSTTVPAGTTYGGRSTGRPTGGADLR